ncbi:ABC transporter substrate-binding protein [Sandaracinus amylolyticus]|uniref:Dipeptide-binding ABC transporter, periplasmic substrate-binding component n=1 Tax=Sandaracinus amylolyticus TaxID=927083 RepID=A0A0F6W3E0_9BACT|nr:ABC transporter substrate-binding protein [Sandaracinus amylolyticus]AKF06475.1 Dipeptide-binding ABC transporter, periplasmic substrate-binding component [Sandaracinus amylolyticus]
MATPRAKKRRDTESVLGLASLAVLAAIVAVVALFLPPMPTEPAFAGAGHEEPQRGGTFVAFHESDVAGFDPLVDWNAISNVGLKLMFEGLVEHDSDLNIVPRLARELPAMSDDGLVYTFRLRDDVRFHHGRALVADDVRWSLEHMMHPDTASPGATFFSLIDGFDDYRARRAEHVRGIRVIDEHTIEIRLSRPDQAFLHSMAMCFAFPVPRENYERWGSEVGQHPVGTGAFELEEWEAGVRVSFRRNDDFYREGEPYLDRVVLELNLGRGPAFMRFLAGDIDHIHRFTPTDYLWFRRQGAWQSHAVTNAQVDIWGIEMNTELEPFTNRHVRRAVGFAMDRDRWNRQRAGRLRTIGQPIPETLRAHDPNLPGAQVHDVARAREEMALAGHPVRCTPRGEGVEGEDCVAEGLEEELDLWIGEGPTGQAYGVLAQQDLATIGIRARLRPVSFPVYLEQTGRPRTATMLFGGWSMDFPDPASMLEPLYHSRSASDTSSSNRAFYRNPELDRVLDDARVERDPERRIALYREASRILVDDSPWAWLFSNTKYEAWQPYVRGFRPNPVWDEMYRDVWLDLPRRRVARALDRAGARSFAALAPFGAAR